MFRNLVKYFDFMKRILLIFIFVFVGIGFLYSKCNSNNVEVVEKEKNTFVIDNEHILTNEQKNVIEQKLYKFNKSQDKAIILITVETIYPFNDILDYAAYLSRFYEKEGTEELVLITVSKANRKVCIFANDNAYPIIKDNIVKDIIANVIIPEFKLENYYLGILRGIDEIINKWRI